LIPKGRMIRTVRGKTDECCSPPAGGSIMIYSLAIIGLVLILSTPASLALAADEHHHTSADPTQEKLMPWEQAYLGARIFLAGLPANMPGSEHDTPEQIALGKRLYFERGISHNKTQACHDCHHLTHGRAGADDTPTSKGASGIFGKRNAPTVINAGFQAMQFWDGRAHDLIEQAKGPILNLVEMGVRSPDEVIEKLRKVEGYPEAFRLAFPKDSEPMTYDNLAKAIAAFERTLIAPGRLDRLMAGDQDALNAQEKRGLTKFIQYRCVECHTWASVGGRLYQKIGKHHPYPDTGDPGRYEVTKDDKDRYVFKVPMLRNVTRTAPYFHDGQVFTIQEAVAKMGWFQLDRRFASGDIDDLVAFLGTLEGNPPPVEAPPLAGRKGTSPFESKIAIPDQLPLPKNKEFLERLKQGLAFEKLAKAQYEADKAKYQPQESPYPHLISQEDDHIVWLAQLFRAYGVPVEPETLPVIKTESLHHAYDVGRKLEKDLFPFYDWLIDNAEDQVTKDVLHVMLHQTEMHFLWFGGSPKDIARDKEK
jgi:cytochrome c peroxidase